jgi:transposase-like protein
MSKHFSAENKAALVERILAGEKLTSVSKEAGISRTILYKWIKIYTENNHATLFALMRHLSPGIRRGRRHYKSAPLVKEHEIIKTALRHTTYSIREIASLVHVSRHCVWTVLTEHQLITPQARELHVQTMGRRLQPSLVHNHATSSTMESGGS